MLRGEIQRVMNIVSTFLTNRSFAVTIIAAWILGAPASESWARDFRVSMLPNGQVFSCANCHVNPGGGGPRNAFGQAVEQIVRGGAATPFWSATLASRDSDGDGFTNGQELGDPDGDGRPADGARVTNPGLASSRPQNVAPTVQIVRPANGTVFARTETIEVEAAASDSDGSVSRVEFFDNDVLAFTATAPPYIHTVPAANLSVGTHRFMARATDNAGGTTTSAAVQIEVAAPANSPPTVQLTQPANGQQFTQPEPIQLAASASDTDGSIVQVEFVVGRSVVFTATNPPYTFSFPSSDLAPGTHSVTARAMDNSGAVTVSAPVQITVVLAAEPIRITDIRRVDRAVRITWTGGTAPFVVQRKQALADAAWMDVATLSNREAEVPLAGETGFFRIK